MSSMVDRVVGAVEVSLLAVVLGQCGDEK